MRIVYSIKEGGSMMVISTPAAASGLCYTLYGATMGDELRYTGHGSVGGYLPPPLFFFFLSGSRQDV